MMHNLIVGDAVLARPNVVFTPHVAFNSDEAVRRLRELSVENIRRAVAGKSFAP